MAFKKSLAALVIALPLVLGMDLIFSDNTDVLNMILQLRQVKYDPTRHATS